MATVALIFDDWRGPARALALADAGFTVLTVDLRPRAKERLTAADDVARVSPAATIAQALATADAVVTVMANQHADEDVYMAGGGIFEAARPESLFIDLSNITPRMAKELSQLAAVHDHAYVEAVALEGIGLSEGGTSEAAPARLLAAGEESSLRRAMPVLGAIAGEVVTIGPAGSAAAARLAWQVATAGSLTGLVEALALSSQYGASKQAMLELLAGKASPVSGIAQALGQPVIDQDFQPGLSVKAFLADLNAALEAAEEESLPLPGLETIQQLFDLLQLIGDDRRGIQSLALAYYDEKDSERFGLDWSLAQKAMDVYERGADLADEYYDDEDEDGFPPQAGHHGHGADHEHGHHPKEAFGFDAYGGSSPTPGDSPKPSTGSFFSEN